MRKHPTNHIDITATIVDIADASQHVTIGLDGLSFKSALDVSGANFSAWRMCVCINWH